MALRMPGVGSSFIAARMTASKLGHGSRVHGHRGVVGHGLDVVPVHGLLGKIDARAASAQAGNHQTKRDPAP